MSNQPPYTSYVLPLSIPEQIATLCRHWPKLDPQPALNFFETVCSQASLPDWVEGWFAIVRPKFFGATSAADLQPVLDALSRDRNGQFRNFCPPITAHQEHCAEQCSQERPATGSNWKLPHWPSHSDIQFIPAQFGKKYLGTSACQSCASMSIYEIGLSTRTLSLMLLTHPHRLIAPQDPWILCAKDRCPSPFDKHVFDNVPDFFWAEGQLGLDVMYMCDANPRFCTPSMFRPENLLGLC